MSKHYSINPLSLTPVLNTVGVLVVFIGVSMLIPLGIALAYGEGDAYAIGQAVGITIASGGLLFFGTRHQLELTNRQGFITVTISWIAAALFGALPLYFATQLSYTDCFFEAMSGFTTTGASILTDIEVLPHGILFWRSLTHWLGGMGIIVFTVTIMPLLGRGGTNLYAAEVPGPVSDKLTPRISETAKIVWEVYAIISLVEFILLWLGPMDWFDAICHTFGTMATGGFSTKNASIAFYNSAYVEWVITLFMILAGTNFALHYFGLRAEFSKYMKSREWQFWMIIIGGAASLILVDYAVSNHYTIQSPSVTEFAKSPIRSTLFQVASIVTTTGFVSRDFEGWSFLAQFTLVSLMLIGGMAGSTGGGIKAIRVLVFTKMAILEIRRMIHPRGYFPLRIHGETIEIGAIRNTTAFLLFYGIIFGLLTLLLTAFGRDMITAMTATISMLSNIGPGLGMVGPTENYAFFTDFEKWGMSLVMMLGRLEILTVMVIFNRYFWRF